jgi:hypothetical protein
LREPDESFRLTWNGSAVLSAARHGENTQHTVSAFLRQSVYERLAGYEDVNDAGRLRINPARCVALSLAGRGRDGLGVLHWGSGCGLRQRRHFLIESSEPFG